MSERVPAPLLLTKLYVPPPRHGLVARPRLTERLDQALHSRLTLVSAPAGFGKTTLVGEWAAGCGYPVAWLSLDSADSDVASFLAYLVAALQTIAPQVGRELRAVLQAPQPPSAESILTNLVNEVSGVPGDIVLVLDDYHVLDSPADDEALAFLVDHQPAGLHLVIATREDPPLPLARLRARGQLTELRAADLRFTPAEAAEFLHRATGLVLRSEDVEALEARTEGWIAGLQMAAIVLQEVAGAEPAADGAPAPGPGGAVGPGATAGGAPAPSAAPGGEASAAKAAAGAERRPDVATFIEAFTGSHRFVLDYLLEEVLHRQPAGVQAFLLYTSLLDRLCGPLCDATLDLPPGTGETTLRSIERANLFVVPLDAERRWFRYHHLFRDLLRRRLERDLPPADIAGLHTRAGEWYERDGRLVEAFGHATAAGDVERAERLIDSEGMPLHLRTGLMPIVDWIASLPESVLEERPLLRVRSATLALMAGQSIGVEEKLQAAERTLAAGPGGAAPDAGTRDLLGQIACARATLALTRYDAATMGLQAGRALELLPAGNLPFRFTALWATTFSLLFAGDRAAAAQACRQCADVATRSGRPFSMGLAAEAQAYLLELDNQLVEAVETYERVLRLAGEQPLPNTEEVHLGLGRIFYEWGDLDAAERHARQSRDLARLYDRAIDRCLAGDVLLARVTLARGNATGAAALLTEAQQTAVRNQFLLRLPEIAAAQVDVLLAQGDITGAGRIADQYGPPLSRARVLVARGETAQALALLEEYGRQMESRGWSDEVLRTLVLRAVALQVSGAAGLAGQTLDEALAAAEPGGFVRLFIDHGAPMAELLASAAVRGSRPAYAARLSAALAAEAKTEAPAPGRSGSSPAAGLLTPRELEVLRLVAEGLSNQEIGRRLFLALDSVKGHNRRIFEKLGVRRRTEAIARARELGLL